MSINAADYQNMCYKKHVKTRNWNNFKIAGFGLFLVVLLVLAITTAIVNSGPIILGTEMNDNGLVEYLCLGNGCDALTDMDW